jgi:hypothetical protein
MDSSPRSRSRLRNRKTSRSLESMGDQTHVVTKDAVVVEMRLQNSVLPSRRIGTIARKIQRNRSLQTVSPESVLILIKVRRSVMVSASNENNGEMIPHRLEARSAKKLLGMIIVSGQGNQNMPPKNRAQEVHGMGFLLPNVKR